MELSEIGRRLRQRRVEMALTQEELAEKAGISISFVGHIVRGEKSASLETYRRLCECLGVSLDWMAYGKRATLCDGSQCDMLNDLKRLIEEYT